MEFLGRRVNDLLAESRAVLAEYLHASPDDLVYFPNPTTAVNMVARSLIVRHASVTRHGNGPRLFEGDEVLTTDHEYGALDRTWD